MTLHVIRDHMDASTVLVSDIAMPTEDGHSLGLRRLREEPFAPQDLVRAVAGVAAPDITRAAGDPVTR